MGIEEVYITGEEVYAIFPIKKALLLEHPLCSPLPTGGFERLISNHGVKVLTPLHQKRTGRGSLSH